jgi:hypothetical protein
VPLRLELLSATDAARLGKLRDGVLVWPGAGVHLVDDSVGAAHVTVVRMLTARVLDRFLRSNCGCCRGHTLRVSIDVCQMWLWRDDASDALKALGFDVLGEVFIAHRMLKRLSHDVAVFVANVHTRVIPV